MTKGSFEVDVVVNGSAVKEYRKDGSTYIEGRKGQSFSVRIRNHSAERVLAVPTIDGLSVVDGKTGSYDSGGYVIGPFDSVTIHGWRTSDKEVAEFYFSDTKESYAAKMDKGGNQGVIGVAIYREKQKPVYQPPIVIKEKEPCPWHPKYPDYPWWWCDTKFSTCSSDQIHLNNDQNPTIYAMSALSMQNTDSVTASSSSTVNQQIGTGFGETRHSEIEKVWFNRDHVAEVFTIYYNTRSELEKLGIDFRSDRLQYVAPKAFPGEYCEPPKR